MPPSFLRAIARIAAVIAIFIALVYLADASWVYLRKWRHHDPTSAVEVSVMLAIPQKNNRIEFAPGDSETQSCVHSLFPHLGLVPCWYLERQKQINF